MKRRKQRPTDPAEAARKAYEARRNPALWGVNEEARQLPSNADVRAVAETRTKTRRVERFDCFATLKLSDHQFIAIRRYHADLAEANGCGDGRETTTEFVDGGGSRELVTSRMMAATTRVLELYSHMTGPDIMLLKCLSYPVWVQGVQANHQKIVRALRGLIDRDAQAKAVKDMSESVRLAYAEIDGQGMRRAA